MSGELLTWGVSLAVVAAIVLPYVLSLPRRRHVDRARKEEAVRLGVDRPPAQFPFIDPMRCIGCGTCVERLPRGRRARDRRRHGHGRERPALRRATGAARSPARSGRSRSASATSSRGRTSRCSTTGSRRPCPASSSPASSAASPSSRTRSAQARKVVDRIAQLAPAARGAGGGDVLDVADRRRRPGRPHRRGRRPRARPLARRPRAGGGPRRDDLPLPAPQARPRPGGRRADPGPAPRGRVREGGPAGDPPGPVPPRRAPGPLRRAGPGARARRRRLLGPQHVGRDPRPGFVILALGRRGTPRKLGVPGEELPKVMYQLADAESYEQPEDPRRGRRRQRGRGRPRPRAPARQPRDPLLPPREAGAHQEEERGADRRAARQPAGSRAPSTRTSRRSARPRSG